MVFSGVKGVALITLSGTDCIIVVAPLTGGVPAQADKIKAKTSVKNLVSCNLFPTGW
jgi:hypothetical protein